MLCRVARSPVNERLPCCENHMTSADELIDIDAYVSSLRWWQRLRVWLARRRLRARLRQIAKAPPPSFVTYERDGGVSVDLNSFLRSPRGRRQLEQLAHSRVRRDQRIEG